MKKLISILACMVLLSGCAATCTWMKGYVDKADVAVKTIQADYPAYLAMADTALGGTAKAWLAAADVSLNILGGVMAGVCQEISKVELALLTVDQSLPKLAVNQQTLKLYRPIK